MRKIIFELEDFRRLLEEHGATMLEKIAAYRSEGFEIVMSMPARLPTSIGGTANESLEELRSLGEVYDTIIFGAPDLRSQKVHLDDKAVTPDEFLSLQYEDIRELVGVP